VGIGSEIRGVCTVSGCKRNVRSSGSSSGNHLIFVKKGYLNTRL
jgi:hypothetical protein